MALTLDKLKQLATAEGLKFMAAPERQALLLMFSGMNGGSYQVVMPVELDGRFLQFRTVAYMHCTLDNPNLGAVLRVIGDLDYRLRLTKFGWDPSDGEIVGYADLWLEDATLTQKQFSAMLHVYLPAIDLAHARLTTTMETGRDPEAGGGSGGNSGGNSGDSLRRLQSLLGGSGGPGGGSGGSDRGPTSI